MRSILLQATAYFLAVFVVGMVLGTLRVLVLEPSIGRLSATLLELPVILSVSWWVCRAVMARFAVTAEPSPRLAVGGLAFLLVMGAEFSLGVFGFGLTPKQYLQAFGAPGPLLGLAAQLAFAAFPWVQLPRRR